MDWFDRIKGYYERGLWSERRVDDAVSKGVITWSQGEEIKRMTDRQKE